MNYKTKQNNIFPVNYPKNRPETPTMNEASKSPPKSSVIKLNFPKMKLTELYQLKQMMALTYGFFSRYSSLGGLIFLNAIKTAIKLMAKMLAPLFILVNKSSTLLIGKFDEMTDDFFSFMDNFFLMDEEQLISVTLESTDNMNMFKNNNGRLNFANSRLVAFRTKMQRAANNTLVSNFNLNEFVSNNSNSSTNYKKSSGQLNGSLPLKEKYLTAIKETGDKMKLQFPQPDRFTLKLPLKTIEQRLSPIKTLFKFPLPARVLHFVDSLVMSEYQQNPFAHDE